MLDSYGLELSCEEPGSAAAWRQAWDSFLHFEGDPVATLDQVNGGDERFVMGPVFTATYRLLGGVVPTSDSVQVDLDRARSRSAHATTHEAGHVRALEQMVAGNFTDAAQTWDQVAASQRDMAATRFAHDVYLHIGDADGRLRSSRMAVVAWPKTEPGYGALLGQHSFALEEDGSYGEAEIAGRTALEIDPDDLWARHALAHVYESTDQQAPAMELLRSSERRWAGQDLLATHIWWHLALRFISVSDHAEALAIFDRIWPSVTTAFRLCDATSLLWRLELRKVEVGDRWLGLADRWATIEERHTSGFLDLHAAMAFARCPGHPGAQPFWDGLAAPRDDEGSQNAQTFETIVRPLVGAIRAFAVGADEAAAQALLGLAAQTRHIGGSIAQRDVVHLTRAAAQARSQISKGRRG